MGKLNERFTPILLLAFIVMAFTIGALWQKVQMLESGRPSKTNNAEVNQANNNPNPTPPSSGELSPNQVNAIPEIVESDHVRGAQNPEVYLIEYSDYYCPYCSRFHPTAQKVIEEYDSEVAWVYRHFPLDSIHPNARPVAEISECVASLAGEDAFWAFTDAVYDSAPENPSAAIDLAVSQGVNRASLQTCYDEERFADKVENQLQGGLTAGITGTPGNLIVTADYEKAWKLPGAVPYAQLTPILDQALGN